MRTKNNLKFWFECENSKCLASSSVEISKEKAVTSWNILMEKAK
jgi:hypothetical protein